MAFDQDMYTLESQIAQLKLGITTPDVGKKPDPFNAPSMMGSVTALPTPPFSPGLKAPWGDENSRTEILDVDDTDQGLCTNKRPTEGTPNPSPSPSSQPLKEFHSFPLLPPELRLKIRYLSFLPRTLELHSRRTHYADWEHYGGSPKWKSQSRNPAALSVCIESRMAALEFYTVALPLDAPLSPNAHSRQEVDSPRVLYINPQHDTVALLGDLHFARLNKLLDWFREQEVAQQRDKKGHGKRGYVPGLRKLAMSTAPWAHDVGAATLRAFSRTVFRDVDEFVLFMYAQPMPPEEWKGGRCDLGEVSPGEDYYRRFVVGRGKQFVDSSTGGWMKVGRNEMRVAEIRFEDGW
ncbi:hypothetical protein QBC43DRAFT_325170 [Cladorrhinum sp. PSN259]|nr:hypothetical protein QBC43DRAFT_325170 [Cladorrhinum sp. PSN259]